MSERSTYIKGTLIFVALLAALLEWNRSSVSTQIRGVYHAVLAKEVDEETVSNGLVASPHDSRNEEVSQTGPAMVTTLASSRGTSVSSPPPHITAAGTQNRNESEKLVLSYGWPDGKDTWKQWVGGSVAWRGTFLGEPWQHHSQSRQDWLVPTLLGCMSGGYFVDLASNDPMTLSNSLRLERDFGWHGVCIEAQPRYQKGLRRRRCDLVNAAVGSPTDTVIQFTMSRVGGGIVGPGMDNRRSPAWMQKINGAKDAVLHTVALEDILDKVGAPPVIHYFNLDVEGAESMVMQGFPWGRFTFFIVTVERPKKDLRDMLEANGYVLLFRKMDHLYIHKTIPRYEAIMAMFPMVSSKQKVAVPPGRESCMGNHSTEKEIGWFRTALREDPTTCCHNCANDHLC